MLNRSLAALLSSVLLGALFIGAPTSVRAGSTIYVGPGRGSGGCASPDYQTNGSADNAEISSAADEAVSGDTIFLCAGTFHFNEQVVLDVVAAGNNLTFQGAGKGVTVLDADGSTTRFFHAQDVSLTFRDLTMQNGSSGDYVGVVWGEGTTNFNIQRSAFKNNYASSGMGVIFSRNGSITVTDSIFDSNYSDGSDYEYGGGAIQARGETALVTVRNSVFTNNYSTTYGGAIQAYGPVVISGSTFIDNESDDDGGAIAVYGDLQVSGSKFSGNITHSEGASIYVECNTRMQVTGSIFNGNHAVGNSADGAAFNIDCDSDSDILINRNIFSNNTAGDNGGAIDEDAGELMVVTNNRFIKNSSGDDGGAIWANYIRMTQNVFIGNTSEICGGAVYVDETDFGTARSNTYSANRGRVGGVREMNVCFWTPK